MLVLECSEIPVVMCELRGASRSFPEVRSGFLEKAFLACVPPRSPFGPMS